jgi:cytochrome c biogenesis protein CcdA/thiol-disulfide isomerase/thioredoxin
MAMLVLVTFAMLAGAGTALSPCVLPILPALLSASGTGGRRRPVGIVVGLAITFTITIVGLATLVGGAGLASGTLRTIAIVALFGFGLIVMMPSVAQRVERPLARLSQFGPKTAGTGFWSGLPIGGAMGLVYAPCAGPVLAAVISVSAAQGLNAQLVAIAVGYSLGSAVVLLAMALGGRRVMDRIRAAGRGLVLQRVLGSVLVATAVLMAFNFDTRFQTAIADNLPGFVVSPTSAIEKSDAIKNRLRDVRGGSKFDSDDAAGRVRASLERGGPLPNLGRAPAFTKTQEWFNTEQNRPLDLAGLRGKVVLVDFWTYSCIDCIRTLPELKALDQRYRDKGLTIVGVHTPEFSFEKKAANVRDAISQNGLRYPVVQDNDYGTWSAYGNQYWPAQYLIDADGNVRYTHFLEGGEQQTEQAIRSLLGEAGANDLGAKAAVETEKAAKGVTRETYVGYDFAHRFLPDGVKQGTHSYPGVRRLPVNRFAYSGRWSSTSEFATAGRNASLDSHFKARKVFLIMTTRDRRPRKLRVLLDGRPIRPSQAGGDVKSGSVTVRGQRLYELVELPRVERRRLTLDFDTGVSAFAFTFG